jgi:hypothetical protein
VLLLVFGSTPLHDFGELWNKARTNSKNKGRLMNLGAD